MSTGPTDPITLENVYALAQSMENRLQNLEAKQYDTRPIWEAVLASLTQLEKNVDELRVDMKDVKKDIASINRQMGFLAKEFVRLNAEQLIIDRVERLESRP